MYDAYQKILMEHYHNSRYRGFIEHADFVLDATSASCGDHIVFSGKGNEYGIIELKFKGEGSILGQAAASLLCEYAIGTSYSGVVLYSIDDFICSLGVDLGPTRRRTIVFVCETLQKGVAEYVASRKIV